MSEVIRVLVVDDDPNVREAYRAFMDPREGLEYIGDAANGQDALTKYDELTPDVVLMDLQMPVMSGIEAIATLMQRCPTARIIALTTFSTEEYIVGALRAGASGYLVKDTNGDLLAESIRLALAGEMPLSAQVRRELVAALLTEPDTARKIDDPGLTPRESQLLGWLVQGQTNQQIARSMFISEGSVKQYLSRIGDKLETHSRTQIVVSAIARGLVDLDTV